MLASLRNPNGWTKASVVRSEKTAIGWIFVQLLGHTALGSTKRNMGFLPQRSSINVNTQFVYPQNPGIFHIDLGSVDHSYRENMMKQTFGFWFPFPMSGRPSLWSQSQGKLRLKITSRKTLSSSVRLSAHRTLGKLSSFVEGKSSTESIFSGLCLAGTV